MATEDEMAIRDLDVEQKSAERVVMESMKDLNVRLFNEVLRWM